MRKITEEMTVEIQDIPRIVDDIIMRYPPTIYDTKIIAEPIGLGSDKAKITITRWNSAD